MQRLGCGRRWPFESRLPASTSNLEAGSPAECTGRSEQESPLSSFGAAARRASASDRMSNDVAKNSSAPRLSPPPVEVFPSSLRNPSDSPEREAAPLSEFLRALPKEVARSVVFELA